MKYSFVLEIEEVRGFCLLHKLDDKNNHQRIFTLLPVFIHNALTIKLE
jgi:hypothetical protein